MEMEKEERMDRECTFATSVNVRPNRVFYYNLYLELIIQFCISLHYNLRLT